jgi:hypothetical protein
MSTSLSTSISELQIAFDNLIAAMKKTSAEFSAIASQMQRPSFLEPLSPQRPLSAEKLQRPPPIDTATPAVAKAKEALHYAEKRPPPIDTATPAAEKAAEALASAIDVDTPLVRDICEAKRLADSLFEYLTEFNPARMQQVVVDCEELLEDAFNRPCLSGTADRALIYFSSQIDNLEEATEHLVAYESPNQTGYSIINDYKIIHEYMTNIKEEMATFGSKPPAGLGGVWWTSLQNSVEAALSITHAVLIEPPKNLCYVLHNLLNAVSNATEYIPFYKNVHIQARFAISLLNDCIGEGALTIHTGVYSYLDTVRSHIRKMLKMVSTE